MQILPIFILAIVQGLTEFLPVSSSGHLILVHSLLGQDKGWGESQIIDVCVHIGTLLSVLVYFRRDFIEILLDSFYRKSKNQTKLGIKIIFASIPVIIAGFILHLIQPDFLRTIKVIAWTTLIGGVLLWFVDAKYKNEKSINEINWIDAMIIGASQIFALVPGVSRSGITMTAARMVGINRTDAAKFSMFLGVIAIAGAGMLGLIDVAKSGDAILSANALVAIVASFVFGILSITAMMRFLEKFSFAAFGVYRIILGLALLFIVYY